MRLARRRSRSATRSTTASLDHGAGKSAGQQRVLAVVLEVPAAQRAALDLNPRAEYHIHANGGGLPGQCCADDANELRVPRRGEGHCWREAGGRKAAAQPEMVGVVVVLHVEAVRAVGDPDARKPKLGDLLRVPIVGAGGEESHELLGGRAAHRCVCRR